MYGSRYARHFYTEDEISRFRAAWKTTEERVPSVSAR